MRTTIIFFNGCKRGIGKCEYEYRFAEYEHDVKS